ncbi:MAG: hypothetical protein JNM17_09835 [Archangium sp.]|nr:hypothetical protein [Archangium sp.]
MRHVRFVLVAAAGLFAAGCGEKTPMLCVPGKSEACIGIGGCMGGQVCKSDGSGFEACDCGMPMGGGAAATGGSGGGATGGGGALGGGTATGGGTGGGGGSGGGIPAGGGNVDGGGAGGGTGGGSAGGGSAGGGSAGGGSAGGGSAGGGSAGGGSAGGGSAGGGAAGGGGGAPSGGGSGAFGPCVFADGGLTGCSPGFKCAWVNDVNFMGSLRCVPNGPVQMDGGCSRGPDGPMTGYDNCAAGLHCASTVCRPVCDTANRASCGINHCTRYSGLFEDPMTNEPYAGVCNDSCNPVTQLTTGGVSCGANQGCYLLVSQSDTIGVCASAGTVQHGVTITGTAFANSCVPGAQPRRRDLSSNASECGGLCAVNDVMSMLNTQDEGGIAPDSCQARWGAAPPSDMVAGESCRYWWAREPFDTGSNFSNTVGWCFKHAVFQYDSNGDMTPDSPTPRCTTLTTGDIVPPIGNPPHSDAEYFWCVQKPPMKLWSPPLRVQQPLLDRMQWR